jgi:hypothetical protein
MKLKKNHNRSGGTSSHNNQARQVENSNDVVFTSLETKYNLSSDVGFSLMAQAVTSVSL